MRIMTIPEIEDYLIESNYPIKNSQKLKKGNTVPVIDSLFYLIAEKTEYKPMEVSKCQIKESKKLKITKKSMIFKKKAKLVKQFLTEIGYDSLSFHELALMNQRKIRKIYTYTIEFLRFYDDVLQRVNGANQGLSEIETKFRKMKIKFEEEENKLISLRKEVKSVVEETQEAKDKINVVIPEIEKLEINSENLQRKLKETDQIFQELKEKREGFLDQIEVLENDLEEGKTKIVQSPQRIKSENEDIKERVRILEADVEKKKVENKDTKGRLINKEELLNLISQIPAHLNRKEELNNESRMLETQLEGLSGTNKEAAERIKEKNSEIQIEVKKLQNVKERGVFKEQELNKFSGNLQEGINEIETLVERNKSRIKNLERECEEVNLKKGKVLNEIDRELEKINEVYREEKRFNVIFKKIVKTYLGELRKDEEDLDKECQDVIKHLGGD